MAKIVSYKRERKTEVRKEFFTGYIFDASAPESEWPPGVIRVGVDCCGKDMFAYVNRARGTVTQIKNGQMIVNGKPSDIPDKDSGFKLIEPTRSTGDMTRFGKDPT